MRLRHNTAVSPPLRSRSVLRKSLLAAVAVATVVAACGTGAIGQVSRILPGRVAMSPLNPEQPKTYEEVLVFGLQAKLPSELAFIDSVVEAVESGKLPPVLVDQTYFWARTRAGNSVFGRATRPIIYFIPALEARVNKLRLNVDFEGGLP